MIYVLAQDIDRQVYLRSMHEQFARSNPKIWWELLLGLVIVLGLLGIVYLSGVWQRWRQAPPEARPFALYRQVLARLNLTPGQMWRLWRLAKAAKIPHPTALLISIGAYDEAVAAYCAGRGALGSRARLAPQFAEIRRRLFGECPAPAAA